MYEQIRLFLSDPQIWCGIFRKRINGRYLYFVDCTIGGDVALDFCRVFESLEHARQYSHNLRMQIEAIEGGEA